MEQIKRVASALIILPPLVLFLVYAPPWLFLGLVLGVICLSVREYFQVLYRQQLPKMCMIGSCLASSLLAIAAYVGDTPWLSMALFMGLLGLTSSVISLEDQEASLFLTLISSVFSVVFIGWGLSHLVLLRHLPEGKWYLLFLCAIIWAGDSSAMYIGKTFGRYKLAPTISPGKTWEGAVACVIGGGGAALLGAGWWLPHMTLGHAALLGLGVSVAAQLSDLGESLIKRHAGVKDSGALIPGHGGMLDRIDSMLFAAPTLVYMLNVLLPVTSP